MFYPQSMTEIELIVPAKDIVSVTRAIRGQGVFHQTDGSTLNLETGTRTPNPWQERTTVYAGFERRVQSIMAVLGVEEGRPPAKEFEDTLDEDTAREDIDQIEQEVKKITDKLAAAQKQLDQLLSNQRELVPVAGIDLDVNAFRKSHYLFATLGTMPTANIDRLHASLIRVPYVFFPLQQDAQRAIVWLAGNVENADILERAARSAYLNPLKLPEGYQGTPAEVLKTLDKAIAEIRQDMDMHRMALGQLRVTYQSQLVTLLWHLRSSRMLTDAIVRYGRLSYTYIIVGWVPTLNMSALAEKVKQISKDSVFTALPQTRRANQLDIPVALSKNKFLRPFQTVVMAYGRPRYDEIDPTILIAITFPLLFGAMFGDVGHGLVLAALGWLLASKRVKALQSMAGLGGVIMACGAVATLFGFLYGSVFGIEDLLHPLWISPMHNIMTILLVAVGSGVVLLSIGFLIGMYNALRNRDWGRLFFDHNGLAGFLLYWSLLMIVLGVFGIHIPIPTVVFVVLAAIGAVVIFFAEPLRHLVEGHRPLLESGVGMYLIQAFFELFETLIGLLSNSLSYVRIGAFAVAHAGLSSVIFILAGMVGGSSGIIYWLVVALGNIFIIGFEGLIVGIQTMRLEYYEFFSKFFTGGGLRYEPMVLRAAVEE